MEDMDSLPLNSEFEGYRILKVLGRGTFGITYLAEDTSLSIKVAIKEYFPTDLAGRDESATVRPRTIDFAEEFKTGLTDFLEEARTLADIGAHDNVVRVLRYFPARNTGYIVMEYVPGSELSDEIHHHDGRVPSERIEEIVLALMNGLQKVHSQGYLHRDLKPSNILIREDGLPVIVDFGTARMNVSAKSRPMTAILTVGYAPIEQYSPSDEQDCYTDIYALAAVAYCMVRGGPPPEATLRRKNDPYQPLLPEAANALEQRLFRAIDWALMPDEEDRPQSIEEWRAALVGTAQAAPAISPATVKNPPPTNANSTVKVTPTSGGSRRKSRPQAPPPVQPSPKKGGQRSMLYGAIAVFAVIGVAVLSMTMLSGGDTDELTLSTDSWTEIEFDDLGSGDRISLDATGAFLLRGTSAGQSYMIQPGGGLPAALTSSIFEGGIEAKAAPTSGSRDVTLTVTRYKS
ncbi:MAG: protein kinase [Pseudomonadota bacterium]